VINGVPDGRFPARDPYPRPEVLGDLAKTVVGSGADLGAATDSDGDRVIFADESGTVHFGDISGCVFISEILKRSKGGVVVTPINASSLVEWTAKKYGGKVVYCKVGPPNIVSGVKVLFLLLRKLERIFGLMLYFTVMLCFLHLNFLRLWLIEVKTCLKLFQSFQNFTV